MCGILSEKYLVIEQDYLANMIGSMNMPTGVIKHVKHEEPKVDLVVAANSYSPEELRWYYGINTEKSKTGLVAIIPLNGVMSRDGWYGANTTWIARQIMIAAENTEVTGIVLRVSSPGGAVDGTQYLARLIAEIKKPIVSWVSHMGASGALWVMSQTTEIWLESKITSVGSLGVMSTIVSYAGQLQKEGIDVRVLRSKGSENKALLNPYEPINDDAIKEEQGVIDMIKGEFLGDVRGKRPQVSADIDGKLYYGNDAIKIGFADNMGSLRDAVKRADFLGRSN